MEKITLELEGQADLVFVGKEIADSSEWENHGDRNNRYTRYTLYETADTVTSCNYILFEEYITHWQGEYGSTTVHKFQSLEEIRDEYLSDEGNISPEIKDILSQAGLNVVIELQ